MEKFGAKRLNILETFLLNLNEHNDSNDTISFIVQCCILTYRKFESSQIDPDPMKLSIASSKILRNKIIQSIYGGAPELVRDRGFFLLFAVLSFHNVLDRKWTIENTPQVDESLPIIVASVVSVEVHLLLEEIFALYYEDCNHLAESIVIKRKHRAELLLLICYGLFHYIIQMLIGYHPNTEKACWASLSEKSIEKIKKCLQAMVIEIFDFVKSITSHRSFALDNKSLSTILVHSSMETVIPWIIDDDQMHIPFLRSIPDAWLTCNLHQQPESLTVRECYLIACDMLNDSNQWECKNVSNEIADLDIIPNKTIFQEYIREVLLGKLWSNYIAKDIIVTTSSMVLQILDNLDDLDIADGDDISNALESLYSSSSYVSGVVRLCITYAKAFQYVSQQVEISNEAINNIDEISIVLSISLNLLIKIIIWNENNLKSVTSLVKSSMTSKSSDYKLVLLHEMWHSVYPSMTNYFVSLITIIDEVKLLSFPSASDHVSLVISSAENIAKIIEDMVI